MGKTAKKKKKKKKKGLVGHSKHRRKTYNL